MAGHSKWHNIKHRKAAVDKRRGKAWTKCAKAIMVAAKNGGPDPASNITLRYAIDEARYHNMPRDTIERAVKKGAGELGSQNFESVRYEGYGAGGIAVVVEALTDNRTRTAADLRLLFGKFGGNLGATGCVGFMFETRGRIALQPSGVEPDRLMEAAIEAGARDVAEPSEADSPWEVITDPQDFIRVKDAVEAAGFTVQEAGIEQAPTNTVRVEGEQAEAVIKLVEALEDNDDVQKVYANFEIPDDQMSALE